MAGKKAAENGIYTFNGGRFKVAAGDAIPDGAEFVEPDDKKKPKRPDKQSDQKTGPSDNTDNTSAPSETS